MRILTEEELRNCVGFGSAELQTIEQAFSKLAAGEAVMPPIQRMDIVDYNGEIDTKAAYVKGFDLFVVKMSTGFFDNHKLGLSSGNGMMVLFCSKTGVPQAILLDNGFLTHLRTGLAGGIAAKYLARKSISTVGVVGGGAQAYFQLKGLSLVRSFHRVKLWSLDPAPAVATAEKLRQEMGVKVDIVTEPKDAVVGSDVVITCTPSKTPLVKKEWLSPGMHITCMGADAEEKQELEASIFGGVEIFCDALAQCGRLGELHHAFDAGFCDENTAICELGDLTSGKHPGRTHDEAITVCDLTGTGVQDTAIACLAFQRAVARDRSLTTNSLGSEQNDLAPDAVMSTVSESPITI